MPYVDVLHERLDVDRRLRVGREDLLGLLRGDEEAVHRLLGRVRVDLVLLLPLRREVVREDHVKVAPAQVAVARGRAHGELALDERDDGDGGVHRAAVDEGDVRLLVGGHVGLVDAVRERRRRRVVHQAQAVEARDLGRVEHRVALGVREVGRDGDDDVGDGGPLVALGDLLHALEEHRHRALGRDHDLLVVVVHRDHHAPRLLLHTVRDELRLALDLLRVELLAHDGLHAGDGVLEVGGDAGERLLAQLALLARKAHHARRQPLGDLVAQDVNAAAARDGDDCGRGGERAERAERWIHTHTHTHRERERERGRCTARASEVA